ncbi:MAG: hypothetical protein ACFCVF_08845 [Kineosporiaceae bacterium]
MENDPLWVVPAMFVLVAAQGLAQSRGRVNLVFTALFGGVVAFLVVSFTVAGSRPPAGLVVVTASGALYLLSNSIRARAAGIDVFASAERPLRGAWWAARVRRRLDRTLRRPPDGPAADGSDPGLGDVMVVCAQEARRGDVVAAVRRLDSALSPPETPSSWPDARLGLMLYHRTVYSALATVAGDSPAQSTRWHNDVDLARTVLPDVRLGWLADAAVAVAEGRLWPAVYATDALLADARGPWEKGLGAVVGRLARDVPDAYRERLHAHLVERNPWVAHLASRLEPAPIPDDRHDMIDTP